MKELKDVKEKYEKRNLSAEKALELVFQLYLDNESAPVNFEKPIILTELFLEKNGIVTTGMRNFIIPNCAYFLIEWEWFNSCKYVLGIKGEYGNDEIISGPFTSAHELQNLLFALNGTELSLS
jgi:hypothetical protein